MAILLVGALVGHPCHCLRGQHGPWVSISPEVPTECVSNEITSSTIQGLTHYSNFYVQVLDIMQDDAAVPSADLNTSLSKMVAARQFSVRGMQEIMESSLTGLSGCKHCIVTVERDPFVLVYLVFWLLS